MVFVILFILKSKYILCINNAQIKLRPNLFEWCYLLYESPFKITLDTLPVYFVVTWLHRYHSSGAESCSNGVYDMQHTTVSKRVSFSLIWPNHLYRSLI